MPFDPDRNVIHTAGGRLAPKSPTSAEDVRRIVREALAAKAASGLVLNFHGGLVSAASAIETARLRLYPLYAERAHAYPIFFVWESGLFEAPLDNLAEIAGEPIFRQFVKKAGEWVLRTLHAGPAGAPSRAADVVAARRFRADLDAWFRTGRARRRLPAGLRHFGARPRAKARVPALARPIAAVPLDRAALAAEIDQDIRGDEPFRVAIEAARAGLHPYRRAVRMARGGGTRISASSLIGKEAAARLFPPSTGRAVQLARGAWIPVAGVVADIVLRVRRRLRTGRDHGKYVTIVEEVLRELYVDKIGRAGWWDRMKGDTADAFRPGEEYGGTALLRALRDALEGRTAPRITLIGHSIGAVYIGHFLEAAAHWVPDAMFDLVFEAPAATDDFLAKVIAEHGSRIADFRLFGMDDEREQADVLMPVIYPASLLYFVSGLLEDEPDEPLSGMQRYLVDPAFDADRFPNVEACRMFFGRYRNPLVWAPRSAPKGCASNARHHQDLDDVDPETLGSVEYILKRGY